MAIVRVFKNGCVPQPQPAAPTPAPEAPKHELFGKCVFFEKEGQRLAGVVSGGSEKNLCIKLAVPNEQGILLVGDNTVIVDRDLTETFAGVMEQRKIRRFDTKADLDPEGKKFLEIQDSGKNVTDYRNVIFEGYASTFKDTTPQDRQGDYILPGAFNDTILDFKRNPVMLADHRNSVFNIAGSYPKISVNERGLLVQGRVSNGPGMTDIRFLIVEGHLCTLSIGGIFLYGSNPFEVEKVILLEISLVAIPANPDALISVRNFSVDDAVKTYKMLASSNRLGFKDAK